MAILTVEQGILVRLSASMGISRIYPGRLPQTVTLPAVTFNRVSGPRVTTHDQAAGGLAHPRFQFDAWATTYLGAKAISNQIRTALNGYTGTITVGADTVTIMCSLIADERAESDGETHLYWISSDYIIWHNE